MTAPEPLEDRAAILRDGVAVGLATGAYGVSFGAVAGAAGLTIHQACTLSLIVFTGASQFALVGVLASGGASLAGAAVGGAFLALLWPRLRSGSARLVAVAALALALGLVPTAPAGVAVLAAAGVALVVGAWGQPDPPTQGPLRASPTDRS